MDHSCYVCFVFVMLSCLLIAALCERACLLALLYVMIYCVFFVTSPTWCPGSGVVLDCIDS